MLDPLCAKLVENLHQNMTELSSLISDRATSVNVSVSSLRGDLQEYKNWTMSELADLQTSLNSELASLNSRVTEEFRSVENQLDAKIDKLAQNMTDTSGLNSGRIDGSVRSLKEDLDLEEHKNQTISRLADLQDSMDTLDSKLVSLHSNMTENLKSTEGQLDAKLNELDSELVLFCDRMGEEFQSLGEQLNATINPLNSKLASMDATSTMMRDDFSCVKTDLSSLNDSMNRVCDKVEEHEDHMTAELMELNEYLKENLTHQISSNDNLGEYTCGGTGGWRRAVYLNMSNTSTKCPSGWRETGYSKRTCSRASGGYYICNSVTFPVSGGEYSQVCGRIKAYQWGRTSGFQGYSRGYTTIDDPYFSGVAVMHGSPRQHIWTFAAGEWENKTRSTFLCPCDSRYHIPIPPFVGEDYFCESGYIYPGYWDPESLYILHSNDTLWDGKDCHSSSTCCSRQNFPYFTKTFSVPTTDNIELRMCGSRGHWLGNVAVELVELYVKKDHLKTKLMVLDHHLKQSFTHQINNINNLGVHTCGGTGGWRRAVYLDMTDPNTDCPSGWRVTGYSKRTCGRVSAGRYTCDSVTFPVSGGEYSHICGRIKAYQWGTVAGFRGYRSGCNTTDDAYFSGVAVMHGSPRQHIWTFVAGSRENITSDTGCPCDSRYYNVIPIPPFVGEDYFCESGYIYPGYWDPPSVFTLHFNDTLWDGRDCHSTSTCCSRHNPPYFTKILSTPTTDDIELRMCNYYSFFDGNVAVELIELYVK